MLFDAIQAAEKEVRLMEAANAGTIDEPLRQQRHIHQRRREGIEAGIGHRQGQVILLGQRLPECLALVDPAPDFVAWWRCAQRQLLLPAVELAHFQQVGTQAHLARIAGVGDVAITLDGTL